MNTYIYLAYSDEEKIKKGELRARNKEELRSFLKEKKLILIRAEIKKEYFVFKKTNSISNKDLIEFTYQLSVMLESGISIKKSLEIQKKNSCKKKMKLLISNISEKISQGGSFKQGIENNSNIFNSIYLSVVEIGEISGNLNLALKDLSFRLEKTEKIEKEIRRILIYPIIVLITAFSLIIFLMIFILPNFVEIYQQNLNELPKLTKLILKVSRYIELYSGKIFFIIILIFVILKLFFNFEEKKYYFHYFLLKIPLIKDIYKTYNVLRILRGVHILLRSGISILKTMDLILKEEKNIFLKKEILSIKNSLKVGLDLEEVLKKKIFFDDLTLTLISLGEKSGNLIVMMEKTIDFLENKLEDRLKRTMILLEPVLMIILSIIVGGILVGIYLPIFDVSSFLG